jgi:hypothetical protein
MCISSLTSQLHDGDDEANQAERLDERRRQNEDGEQTTFNLWLARHATRDTIRRDADAERGTDNSETISYDVHDSSLDVRRTHATSLHMHRGIFFPRNAQTNNEAPRRV